MTREICFIIVVFILFVLAPTSIILAIKHKPCKHNWKHVSTLHKQIESGYRPGKFLDNGATLCYQCTKCGKFRKVDMNR